MPAPVLDVHSRSDDPVARGLSNFAYRPFLLDEVQCGSMEGFLQSLKFQDPEQQTEVAKLVGYQAFKRGQEGNGWKTDQTLWWRGDAYARQSPEYAQLLTRAYDAQLDQDPLFVQGLVATVGFALRHTLGKANPTDTVLTEKEYIDQLQRLRWRALEKAMSS